MHRHLLVIELVQRSVVARDAGGSGHSSGSIGMLFVVLVVIVVLGLLAGLLARICGGRHVSGHREYDFEGWVERKCASCIDGSMPPPPAVGSRAGGDGGGVGADSASIPAKSEEKWRR